MSTSIVDAPLPARWGRWQRLKNTLIYHCVVLAIALAKRTPFLLAYLWATALGHVAATVIWGERRKALRHLQLAMPELSAAERRQVVRCMFVHLGQSAVELLNSERFLRGAQAITLSDAQRALMDEALALGHGVVAVTGHIGNWELFAQVLAHAGYRVSSVAKPLYDPRLTRLVHNERTALGMRLLWRGDPSVSKDIMRVFKNNEVLGLLIDQDTDVQGDFVPFFGQQAFTPTAPASLALRFRAPVIVGWMHRVQGQHRIHLEVLPPPENMAEGDEVRAYTALMTERLEAAIRQVPAQWVWLHRRFRTQRQAAPASQTHA